MQHLDDRPTHSFTIGATPDPAPDEEPLLATAAGTLLMVAAVILMACSPAIVIATWRALL